MNIGHKPARVLAATAANTKADLRPLTAGPLMTVNKQPAANKGFVKELRKCAACHGSGTQPAEDNLYRIAICSGCNGRGYVREWRKEQ
jgi:mono/diheme cytochrome c family protein